MLKKRLRIILFAIVCAVLMPIAIVGWTVYDFFRPDQVTFRGSPYNQADYAGLLDAREVWFGDHINGRLLVNQRADKVLLFSHPMAVNISVCAPSAHWLAKQGFSVLVYDYRGTGKSGGHMSERSMIEDACAAYDYLSEACHYQPSQIIGYGESLGTGVTAQLAVRRPLGAVILVGSFPTWASAANDFGGVWLRFYPTKLYPDFNSAKALATYTGPTLIVHGGKDQVLSVTGAKILYAAASGQPKTFLFMPGMIHCGASICLQSEADQQKLSSAIHKLVGTNMSDSRLQARSRSLSAPPL